MAGDALFGTGTAARSTSHAQASRDADLVSALRNLFQVARDHKRQYYDTWIRNYRLVHNRYGSGTASTWAPAPRDSEIYPTLSALVAWMTDQAAIVDFAPVASPQSKFHEFVKKITDDLNEVFSNTWSTEHYNYQIKMALWDAFMYGAGIFKNIWDNQIADGYGDAVLRRTDPWAFYPDPLATSLDDAEYFIEARRMSLDEIERRYGASSSLVVEAAGGGTEGVDERPTLFTDASRVPKANPGTIPQSGTYGSVGSSGFSTFGRPSNRDKLFNPNPSYVVYEFWLKENEPWDGKTVDGTPDDRPGNEFKSVNVRWRVVVMAASHILMDEYADELWSHAGHPYERFVFDDIGEFYGISLVDHLAYPQIYINRLLTALQQNTELVGNPIFMEPANSGLGRVGIINRPGQRLTISGPAANQNRPEWLTPPSMPPVVLELINFWIQRIENTSGLSAIVKGNAPAQRNAEGVISSVQEAAFVRIRSALANLEHTLEKCSMKLGDLMVDNYTEPRIISMIGPDGQSTIKELGRRHFNIPTESGEAPLRFTLRIQAGSTNPTSRQSRVAEADKLFTLGAIDDQALLEAHQFSHVTEVLKRLYDKRQKGLIGGGPGKRERSRA